MLIYEVFIMQILSENKHAMGGISVLVKYGENSYGYGFKTDLHTLTGFPIAQCGSKEKVLEHCKSISELCRKNIAKYQKELQKSKNPDGWKLLIEQEQEELEMLTQFAEILSK